MKIAILVSEFNSHITNKLLSCCRNELLKRGVKKSHILVESIPGAYELPFAAYQMARTKKFKAVICLGCIIKGQTSHDVFIANWSSLGSGLASLLSNVPVLFGVLTPHSERQALLRVKPGPLNRGKEVAEAALKMIRFSEKRKR